MKETDIISNISLEISTNSIVDSKMWSSTCKKCGSEKGHSERYDAYYCNNCNEWQEKACDDPTCNFCVGRPEKPLNK